MMLIYAEALNETGGSPDEIMNMLNTIRQRSFMAPVPPTIKGDKVKTNEYIQRERRVEFFYENKRWFNARLYLEPSSTTQLSEVVLGDKLYYRMGCYPAPKVLCVYRNTSDILLNSSSDCAYSR
jgi:hypothetical protein